MVKYTKKHSKSSKDDTRKKTSSTLIKKIPETLFKKYNELSPFELKNILVKMAESKNPDLLLNAGRGNPNFFNVFCRTIFAKLQLLCIDITNKNHLTHDINIYPSIDEYNYKKIILAGLKNWSNRQKNYIDKYIHYLKKKAIQQNLNPNHILHDLVLSTLGTFYPSPPQMQPHLRLVCERYLYDLVMGTKKNKNAGKKMKPTDFDFFATEGAAAGILYVFNTLHENYLLKPKDSIALITPIFSPYLEMPKLSDYNLKIVELKGNPNNGFSLDNEEIAKLKNKKIKALFMVNPANPGAFSLSQENIDAIGHLANTERQDLIVISDSVYAPFVRQYNSFMSTCPLNTIEIFSLSKYFGTTGWRLGLVMISKNNRFNKLLQNLTSIEKKKLYNRYKIATIAPEKLTFMQRLVLDSRQVAEAHVGGLSTPQQVLIGLFLFYDMFVQSVGYSKEIHHILYKRINKLYEQLNTKPLIDSKSTNYYALLYVPEIAENLYGLKARKYLEKNYTYLDFLFYLAKKYHVVLLPGGGFGTSDWRVRVSLANLNLEDYTKISKAFAACIKEMVKSVL